MSFVTQQDVFDAVEPVMRGVFEEFGGGKPVTPKFPMIPYAEAMRSYGSDKPDLRNPIKMQNVSDAFRGSGFKIFANMLAADPQGRGVGDPGAGRRQPRAFCDRMNEWAQGRGPAGPRLYLLARGRGGRRGSARQEHRARAHQADRATKLGLGVGDAVFFVAGKPKEFVKFAGPARTKVGEELNLVDKDQLRVLLDRRFPDVRVERGGEEDRLLPQPVLDAEHARSRNSSRSIRTINDKILGMKAIQYDIVCNGIELSSGAIRNHRPDVMKKAFAIAGYGEDVLEEKFGGMLRALSLGAPPHGGIAPGIDRIVMLLCGEENLREVVLFPMNQRAEDLLMGAPSEVTPKQLRELHIRLALPKK